MSHDVLNGGGGHGVLSPQSYTHFLVNVSNITCLFKGNRLTPKPVTTTFTSAGGRGLSGSAAAEVFVDIAMSVHRGLEEEVVSRPKCG